MWTLLYSAIPCWIRKLRVFFGSEASYTGLRTLCITVHGVQFFVWSRLHWVSYPMAQAGCYGLPTRLPELWGSNHGVRLEFVLFRSFLVLAIYLAYIIPQGVRAVKRHFLRWIAKNVQELANLPKNGINWKRPKPKWDVKRATCLIYLGNEISKFVRYSGNVVESVGDS